MDLNRLRQINEANQSKEIEQGRQEALLGELTKVQESVIQSVALLIEFLGNRTSKTEVVNQLTEIGTPDALKVVSSINDLHETIKTHENTDLTEVTNLLKEVLDEAKKLPKDKVDITIPEQKDYVAQFKDLKKAIDSVVKAVNDQDLKVEAPVVNVPETNVNVEAPDLSPINKGLKDIVKAVQKIVIPEYKTDNKEVEKLLKKSNKLLEEITNMSFGGGGGGTSWVATNSDGIPVPIQLNPDGTLPISSSGSTNYVTLIDETTTPDVTYIGKALPTGSAVLTSSAVWQITRIDESSSPTTIKYADGDLLFDNTFESLAGKTYH